MADRLTQLQDCLDQLATQLYASIRYITSHHPSSPLAGQQRPGTPPGPQNAAGADQINTTTNNDPPASPSHRPDTPDTFAAATRELAHDLVLKQKQIEALINTLPGIEKSEEDQTRRIKELDVELRQMEEERREVVEEKERLLERVEAVIAQVKRV
ncbi:RNA polymerase II mediator complex subunit [Lambiella insularis]|nr:RNA polymerase II mediator complex subunit [Lambiella insularis]